MNFLQLDMTILPGEIRDFIKAKKKYSDHCRSAFPGRLFPPAVISFRCWSMHNITAPVLLKGVFDET